MRLRTTVAALPRPLRLALVAYFGLASSGCVSTARNVELPPLTYQRLERGGTAVSPVRATLRMEGNVARGHVEWAATCERMVIQQPRTQAVVETGPDRTFGIASVVGGGIFGTAALATAFVQTVNEVGCHVNYLPDEDESPADCQESHAGAAVMGVAAVALLVTGIAILVSKPSVAPGAVSFGAPTPPRPVAENVACDTSVVAGLGVALYRGEERIAAAISDANGNFALELPPELSGSLDLVVDVVPPNAKLVRQGDLLGRWDALERHAALDVAEPLARP